MRPEGRIDWSAGRGRPRFPGRRGWLRGRCRAGHVPVSAFRSRERPSPKARSWLKSPKPRARHHRRGDRLCVPALQCTAAPARALLVEGDSSLGAAPSTAVSHPGPGPSVSFPTRCVPRRGPRPRAAR